MIDHYQVKFVRHGVTFYGVVDSFSEEAKAAIRKRPPQLLVRDAIRPMSCFVPESEVKDVPCDVMDEYHEHVEAVCKAAYARHDKLLADMPEDAFRLVPGLLFSVGVGDGSAHYEIVKVLKRSCDVEWRGFCLDRWADHHFGYGGRFQTADVARYVQRAVALAKLFPKRSLA